MHGIHGRFIHVSHSGLVGFDEPDTFHAQLGLYGRPDSLWIGEPAGTAKVIRHYTGLGGLSAFSYIPSRLDKAYCVPAFGLG